MAISVGIMVWDLYDVFRYYNPEDVKVTSNDQWYDPWHLNIKGHMVVAEYPMRSSRKDQAKAQSNRGEAMTAAPAFFAAWPRARHLGRQGQSSIGAPSMEGWSSETGVPEHPQHAWWNSWPHSIDRPGQPDYTIPTSSEL